MSSRIILIGDTHIPEEAEEIPGKFLEEAEEADLILFTGDLTENSVLEELMDRADVRIAKGEDDYLELPEQDVVNVEKMKFGMIHGHQFEDDDKSKDGDGEEEGKMEKLLEFAELMDVDVLVTGHTHKPFRTEKEGVVLYNPGTATGVDKDGSAKRTCFRLEVEEMDITESKLLTP